MRVSSTATVPAAILTIAGVAFWSVWAFGQATDQLPRGVDALLTALFLASPLLALLSLVLCFVPGRSRLALVALTLHTPIVATMILKVV